MDHCVLQDLLRDPPFFSDIVVSFFNNLYLHAQPLYIGRFMRGWKNLNQKAGLFKNLLCSVNLYIIEDCFSENPLTSTSLQCATWSTISSSVEWRLSWSSLRSRRLERRFRRTRDVEDDRVLSGSNACDKCIALFTWYPTEFHFMATSDYCIIFSISWFKPVPVSLGAGAQQYAGDRRTQAPVHRLAVEATSLVKEMFQASEVLCDWMSSNCLQLNPGQTEFIWLGIRGQIWISVCLICNIVSP